MKNRLTSLVKVIRAARPRSTPVRLLGFLPLLAVTMAAGPCGKEPLGSVDGGASCTYEGKVYRAPSSFPTLDGCNTCTCGADGLVACTHRTCLDGGTDTIDAAFDMQKTCVDPVTGGVIPCDDGGVAMCMYQGKLYPVGDNFPASDGCNLCTCAKDGLIACTLVACQDAGTLKDAGAIKGACTPGKDQTCNEDPSVSALRGKCQPDGSCVCSGSGTSGAVSPFTGKCLAPDNLTGNGCEMYKTYPVGSKFPCGDSQCITCMCVGPGKIDMFNDGCADAGAPLCGLDAVYIYGDIGGLRVSQDQVTIAPSPASPRDQATYVRTRNNVDGAAGISCNPPFPACGDTSSIDVSDIMADIQDPVVQKYLTSDPSKAPFLGFDTRPIDGTAFSFMRGDGHGFLVGQACGTSSSASSCVPIPPTIDKLVKDLRALDNQQLGAASCAALR